MSEEASKATSGKRLWAGRVVSGLPVLALVASGILKLSHGPQIVEGFVGKLGYPEGTLTPIGLTEILCAVLYAVPRTSVLGAMALTAYLGGATATHVRVGDPFIAPVLLGILVWVGLYLREGRLAALVPLRKL